jgi:hypothetical protein
MPGVMILEALAQRRDLAVSGRMSSPHHPHYFVGIDHARFKSRWDRDQLLLHVTSRSCVACLSSRPRPGWRGRGGLCGPDDGGREFPS